jgi:hypothetical protein
MGELMLIQFGGDLPDNPTIDDYFTALEEGIFCLTETPHADNEWSAFKFLCEWDIDEELFSEDVTDLLKVSSHQARMKKRLVPGTLLLAEVSISGHMVYTPDGDDYDVDVDFQQFHIMRPRNWEQLLELESDYYSSLQVCSEDKEWGGKHYITAEEITCQEQRDWRLCEHHYRQALRLMQEVYGEQWARDIDPLHDLRVQAVNAQVSGWCEWPHKRRAAQDCQDEKQLREMITAANSEHRRNMAYWQSYN